MTTGTISPLRQRMIEDVNARNLSEGKRCSDHVFHAMAREGMMRGHEHPSI